MATPKKKLTARLAVVRTHTLTIGVPPNEVTLENLNQTGEWEGFIKLENAEGDNLILEVTDDLGGVIVGQVVKGSQPLLDQLTAPPAPK